MIDQPMSQFIGIAARNSIKAVIPRLGYQIAHLSLLPGQSYATVDDGPLWIEGVLSLPGITAHLRNASQLSLGGQLRQSANN